MDQLFLMQRYWGSDEEDDKVKENSITVNPFESPKTLNGKRNSDITLVDLSSDDCMLPNKKQKLDISFKISTKINNNDNSNSDIEIVDHIKNSDALESVKREKKLNGTDDVHFKLKPKTAKKQRLKEAKLQQKDEEIGPEENCVSSITLISDPSMKTVKLNKYDQCKITDDCSENNSKKEKKRALRYFELQDDDGDDDPTFVEYDQFNKMTNNTSAPPLQGLFNDNNEVISKNIKKSKLREKEIDDSGENTTSKDIESKMNSNAGRKQRLRYFDVGELNNAVSVELDQLDKKAISEFPKIKDKIIEGPLYSSIDGDEKIKLKNGKKLKFKPVEIDENGVNTVLEDNTDMKLQNVGNVGESFITIGQAYQQKDEIVKHTLPHWLSNPTYISVNLEEKETPVSELSYIDHNTKNNLTKSGINFLFPVQLAVIPWLMQSKEQSLLIRPSDICVSAPTGSGKTLAFVLPIVQSLKERVVCAIRALVVLPVSELAIQVYKVFQTYIQGTDLKVALLTGKKSFTAEQNFLVKSTGHSVQSLVDILVTTPGRVLDHIHRTQGFCLKRLRYLVIDEADRMMEEIQQGWLKQVEDAVLRDCIFSNCVCASYKRTFFEPISAYNFGFISQPLQKLLYSATLTQDPEQLHTLSLYKPKLFTASSCSEKDYKGSCAVPSGLKMLQVICKEGIKPMVICHLIRQHNFRKVLCFTETVERAHRLHLVLEEMGLFQVREISSFNRAVQRKIVLDQFSSGKIDVLVCSDLVARGIDIENIDCVISYDIPQYIKIYIHRIGRTARAGKGGTAIALLSEGEIPRFRNLLNTAEIQLPEKICINSQDLKPLVTSFQSALSVADSKLKKEKNQLPGKLPKSTKRKR